MSDIAQGEGWWQASDLKWYPPEQHPDLQAPPEPAPPAPLSAPPVPPTPEPPPPAPEPPPPATSNAKWIVVGVVAVAVIAIGAFVLLGRGDGKKNTVAASSSASSNSSSTSSPSSSPSSSSPLTEAELKARLLTTKDFGADFKDDTFSRNTDPKLPCGTPNPDLATPPKIDIGVAAHAPAGISVQEEVVIYQNDSNEQTAFAAVVRGYDCAQGTITNSSSSSQPIQFTKKSRAQELNVTDAVEIDFTASGFRGQLFFIRTNAGIVAFAFSALDTVDTTALPDALTIVKQGLAKLHA